MVPRDTVARYLTCSSQYEHRAKSGVNARENVSWKLGRATVVGRDCLEFDIASVALARRGDDRWLFIVLESGQAWAMR